LSGLYWQVLMPLNMANIDPHALAFEEDARYDPTRRASPPFPGAETQGDQLGDL
jgi:hypothetical protein